MIPMYTDFGLHTPPAIATFTAITPFITCTLNGAFGACTMQLHCPCYVTNCNKANPLLRGLFQCVKELDLTLHNFVG